MWLSKHVTVFPMSIQDVMLTARHSARWSYIKICIWCEQCKDSHLNWKHKRIRSNRGSVTIWRALAYTLQMSLDLSTKWEKWTAIVVRDKGFISASYIGSALKKEMFQNFIRHRAIMHVWSLWFGRIVDIERHLKSHKSSSVVHTVHRLPFEHSLIPLVSTRV